MHTENIKVEGIQITFDAIIAIMPGTNSHPKPENYMKNFTLNIFQLEWEQPPIQFQIESGREMRTMEHIHGFAGTIESLQQSLCLNCLDDFHVNTLMCGKFKASATIFILVDTYCHWCQMFFGALSLHLIHTNHTVGLCVSTMSLLYIYVNVILVKWRHCKIGMATVLQLQCW